MGTPDFAVPSLEKIIDDGHEVAAVFTQPDKPRGRGHHLMPTPVKEIALRHGIAVYQPLTLKDDAVLSLISGINPDCIVVVAYGRILPETVLKAPKLGCINVHASLLPRYRGAAPIQWAVISGEKVTGNTTMFMAKGLDTGDIILQEETKIGQNETSGELRLRLMESGALLLSKTLTLLAQGKAPREVQSDGQSNYASMIDKEMAKIDWKQSATIIHNLVRGMNPQPTAFTIFNGLPFKILETRITDKICASGNPGTVAEVGREGIYVCCGENETLLLTQVQAQGGKKMAAGDYVLGHGIKTGTVFGENNTGSN
jgi:methionyl-tRNA formyltransferase